MGFYFGGVTVDSITKMVWMDRYWHEYLNARVRDIRFRGSTVLKDSSSEAMQNCYVCGGTVLHEDWELDPAEYKSLRA